MFIDRLIDITEDAETVSTLNFSPPRGKSPDLDRYFDAIQNTINSSGKLRSFRSINNVNTPEKARWVFERALQHKHRSNFSISCLSEEVNSALLGFHIVFIGGEGYTFVYPPVGLDGPMNAILINNPECAEAFRREFEQIWKDSIKVCQGVNFDKQGIEFLESKCAELIKDKHFLEIKQQFDQETKDNNGSVRR